MHDKVSRLRQLMSEAIPRNPQPSQTSSPAELDAWRAFQRSEFNSLPPPREQNPRARSIRTINRIANWYGWPNVVQDALDAADCSSIGELDDEQLETLLQRMVQLESCAQEGMDSPFAPPAR